MKNELIFARTIELLHYLIYFKFTEEAILILSMNCHSDVALWEISYCTLQKIQHRLNGKTCLLENSIKEKIFMAVSR